MKKLLIQIVLLASSTVALADGVQMGTVPKLVRQECAACHMVYPPAFLPKESWRDMFTKLDKHYGVDASLDAASVQNISQWFEQNAGTYKRVGVVPPENRITKSAWFIRKHREIAPNVWNRVSIKSAANCVACHTSAETGNFDEHAVRIPK